MTVAPHPSPDAAIVDAFPIRLGSPAQFAEVRALLERSRFREAAVCERLGIPSIHGFEENRTSADTSDALGALIRLFMQVAPLEEALAVERLGADGVAALRGLGLLAAADGAVQSAVLLYPTEGLWIASDVPPGWRPEKALPDLVYPAVTDGTRIFLSFLPTVRELVGGARALELCAGTGIAALRAARDGASEGWATDVTARSVHFARFNAALNDLANVRVVQSDVWSALEGETFDHVYAHPPYVPALQHEYDFRDAGEDGERVTRRIVQGLPTHLRPGGRFYATCVVTDRTGDPVEARLRRWLGEASAAFDLVLVQRGHWDTVREYRGIARRTPGWVDAERWLRHFEALGIEHFVYCSFELRHRTPAELASGRPPLTERRIASPLTGEREMDWCFRWARHAADTTCEQRWAHSCPRLVRGAVAQLTLEADASGSWKTMTAAVEARWPIVQTVEAPAMAPALLELCDGTRDVPALLEALREAGMVEDDVGTGEIAAFLDLLASTGMVATGAVALPPWPIGRRAPSAAGGPA